MLRKGKVVGKILQRSISFALMGFLVSTAHLALAADTDTPLKGLKSVYLLLFPAVGSRCYELDPTDIELRLNDAAARELVNVGLTIPLPQPGSPIIVQTYLKVTDHLLEMNSVNCLDRIEVGFMYSTNIQLSYSQNTFRAEVPLKSAEAIIVGAGKDDFLRRREAAIVQLFQVIAREWKQQNWPCGRIVARLG